MKKILTKITYITIGISFALLVVAIPKSASANFIDYHHFIPYDVTGTPISVTLTASPASMTLPTDTTRLTWATSTNPLPDSCSGFSSWSGLKTPLPTGFEDMTGLAAGTYVYSIMCSKGGFSDVFSTAVVIVNSSGSNVTASLSANPTTLPYGGGTSDLTWSSTNATSCVGTGFNTGGATAGGPVTVSLTSTTTYYLTCNGASGSAQAQASVIVLPSNIINGRCSSPPVHFSCAAGTSINNSGTSPGPWTWSCQGSGGGSTASCLELAGGGGGSPECSDGVDNADPEDKLADDKDPGCLDAGGSYDPNDNNEVDGAGGGGDVTQCNDGLDNDGDGTIDYSGEVTSNPPGVGDSGCSSSLDNSEKSVKPKFIEN